MASEELSNNCPNYFVNNASYLLIVSIFFTAAAVCLFFPIIADRLSSFASSLKCVMKLAQVQLADVFVIHLCIVVVIHTVSTMMVLTMHSIIPVLYSILNMSEKHNNGCGGIQGGGYIGLVGGGHINLDSPIYVVQVHEQIQCGVFGVTYLLLF